MTLLTIFTGCTEKNDQDFPHYLSCLGYLGFDDKAKAIKEFKVALEISPDFLSAKIELDQLK